MTIVSDGVAHYCGSKGRRHAESVVNDRSTRILGLSELGVFASDLTYASDFLQTVLVDTETTHHFRQCLYRQSRCRGGWFRRWIGSKHTQYPGVRAKA